MAITPTSTAAASSLATQLFKSVDANSDGKLSTDEFQSFLENLLSAAAKKSDGLGSAASAVAATANTAAATAASGVAKTVDATPKVYQPMLGFDYVKLNTPSHATPKYVFARATQDIGFAFDRASRSAGLQQIADYAKQNGYPNTTVVGDDKLDFGDGSGAVDVLTSDGQWWWGPA